MESGAQRQQQHQQQEWVKQLEVYRQQQAPTQPQALQTNAPSSTNPGPSQPSSSVAPAKGHDNNTRGYEEVDEDNLERPWYSVHHWNDPGPPSRDKVDFGSGESCMEQQLTLQASAYAEFNPSFLRVMQLSNTDSIGNGVPGSSPLGGFLPLPSAQRLSKVLQERSSPSTRGSSESLPSTAAPSPTTSACSAPSQTELLLKRDVRSKRRFLRGGNPDGYTEDSYDPYQDESYSDEVASMIERTISRWQAQAGTVHLRQLPKGRCFRGKLMVMWHPPSMPSAQTWQRQVRGRDFPPVIPRHWTLPSGEEAGRGVGLGQQHLGHEATHQSLSKNSIKHQGKSASLRSAWLSDMAWTLPWVSM
ncbi:hypothetical protein CEUSTIGMA_g5289.t1 [Chlamydomonas eustigma]|uniref:Uncharacterized protein n=1 Tax=Chlamydomonas eustigma TaxID=1157962 RepID=A0A250X441_9CHLO|nr:hypothetical protein CEUSTIGMA_g5289.t1 [Chlamydomonas eustigma]|eukprot:GAX77847.1 hypothetical protein CEUSTIGMA_g5289.t1 [Chlamydomonas eustigma]